MSRTRNCVRCSRLLREDSNFCNRCDANSIVRLCSHLSILPAWRTMIRNGDDRPTPYALTVGHVTVAAEPGMMLPLIHAETGRTIGVRDPRGIPAGAELVVRMTMLDTCSSCGIVYLLPDSEAAMRGEPRIVRQSVTAWAQPITLPVVVRHESRRGARFMIEDADIEEAFH